MMIVNTGDGKGKTTAAIGQAIRSLGRGWKVCIIQLFKGEEFYGEQKILKNPQEPRFLSFRPKASLLFSQGQPQTVKMSVKGHWPALQRSPGRINTGLSSSKSSI
jgi:ATP:corrinoid adenosyltransferase